ncbi:MAG: hypothetical protein KGR26_15535, partial [Cyanobacteria bacterium REEB65]|nr:hypothetical protein [Cyanobacteria bacterium REEB65]
AAANVRQELRMDDSGMSLETVRELIRNYLGLELDEDDLARIQARLSQQLKLIRQLEALELGEADPRQFHYIADRRLVP